MPQQTKIFRVFVSSTFTDMIEERRILQKKVFPKLEKFCEEKAAKFQAVDLRWGVNEDSQLNQKTLVICLNEIYRCQRMSPKPNFLILIGDKYGWQPLPPLLPEAEMKVILPLLQDSDRKVLDTWYKIDFNSIPPIYVLQPRVNEFREYPAWRKTEKEIRSILRDTVKKLSFSGKQKEKYFASATHQEIISGVYGESTARDNSEEHVVAFAREIERMPIDSGGSSYIDLTDGVPDKYCLDQLNKLKQDLSLKLGENYFSLKAKWSDGKSLLIDPDGFADKAYNFLMQKIKEQLDEIQSPDEVDRERRLHVEFQEKLTAHFCGRDEILKKIYSYLADPSEIGLLALIGESGSGKSSVMAQAVGSFGDQNKDAVLVMRFLGTTSVSSGIVSLLQSVCTQVAGRFDTTIKALAGEGKEDSINDLYGLTEIFKKCLELAERDKPVIIFLDALDQLSDSDISMNLSWLPRELPENAKLVVSALPKIEPYLQDHKREYLPVLPAPEAKQVLEKWLRSINRKLTNEQQNEVLEKFSHTGLPIWLKVAFENARQWTSYMKNFDLAGDVKGIINDLMDNLEREHTRDLVEHVVCYMLCGKYQGLAESEILEILVFDKEYWEGKFLPRTHPNHREELKDATKIPIVVWSRFYFDLEPFLTERDADGVPIITFFHRQFNEILCERYN